MAAVTEQTTEAFDRRLIGLVSYREVEFTETSLIANPWYVFHAQDVRSGKDTDIQHVSYIITWSK